MMNERPPTKAAKIEEFRVYAPSRHVENVADCYFYHSMEIPGYGVINGEWDLRPNIDRYLGRYDFRGKRVLDVGAASGLLSFYMEKAGAEVVSYDLSEAQPWDVVPFGGVVELIQINAAERIVCRATLGSSPAEAITNNLNFGDGMRWQGFRKHRMQRPLSRLNSTDRRF